MLDIARTFLPEALAHLRTLVGINSFTANAAGVDAVADETERVFAPLGFTAQRVKCEIPGTGHHLFLSRPGAGGPPVVLVTHSDTVFPAEEEQRNDFRWEEHPESNRISGPGVVDNKGGTMLIWMLLQTLKQAAPEVFERTHWIVAANAAEEVTGDDFGHATARLCGGQARAVLVFEGGPVDERGWHLVTSRKGRSTWSLHASGRAAHAGSQHADGINAIDALALALPGIAAQTCAEKQRTVNLGFVHGGTVVNRVPHEALAEWECRAVTPAALEEADAYFASLSGKATNGALLKAERTGFTSPWPGGEAVQALYRHWEKSGQSLGLRTVSVPRGGLSDANHLWQLGPILDGLGPFGGYAHCSERSADGSKQPEFVETTSFVPKTALNATALLSLLAEPEA